MLFLKAAQVQWVSAAQENPLHSQLSAQVRRQLEQQLNTV
jgi:hypothetical protein